MGGFAGFMGTAAAYDREAAIKKVTERIRHRGPDGEGFYVDESISLGLRQFSMTALGNVSLPVANEDGGMVILLDGNVYNYADLRAELEKAGHAFSTSLECEAVLHGYEEYGAGVLDKIRGSFAFVIWDKAEKKLFGAKDIFGGKPLYYYQCGEEFLFASEIKAFLDHPEFRKELMVDFIPLYLSYEYLPDENTLFKNVYKLPAAHYFTYQNGILEIERYYKIEYKIEEEKSLESWVDEISREFAESVNLHRQADAEIGSFLSSGVDSSYVLNEAAKHNAEIKTFSIGFDEEKYSELPYAQEFAKTLGVPNIACKVSADDFFGAAADIQYFLDEPLPNPSEIPLYFLTKNARGYVKAALSGEGADELFGGYPIYLQGGHFANYVRRVPKALRKIGAGVARILPNFKGRSFIIRGAKEPYQRFLRASYVFRADERQKFLKKPISTLAPEEYSKKYFLAVQNLDEPTQLQYVDMHTWLPYAMILKADRMSMANSLELRVPFMDRKMLELALRIPSKFRAHNEETKIAMRHAAIKELPEKTANKPKLGFPVPLNDWLREDKYYGIVKEAFLSETAERFFVTAELVKLLDEHKAAKAHNMQKIWSFYSFILWYDKFFG